jgi:hypothetical protein
MIEIKKCKKCDKKLTKNNCNISAFRNGFCSECWYKYNRELSKKAYLLLPEN